MFGQNQTSRKKTPGVEKTTKVENMLQCFLIFWVGSDGYFGIISGRWRLRRKHLISMRIREQNESISHVNKERVVRRILSVVNFERKLIDHPLFTAFL
jgi:hypothetical protein